MNSDNPSTSAVLPMSFSQQRFWLLHQLDGGSPAYHVVSAIRLRGVLDPARLEQALAVIVSRHEILRTTFSSENDRPVQRIHEPGAARIERVRIAAASSPKDQLEWVRNLAVAEIAIPFDLASGPLFRLTLYELSAQDHVLLTVMHHIIFDGWSAGVLIAELNEIYAASLTGRAPQLPELEIQYADFSEWQREWLAGPRLERLLDYWKTRLANRPASLDLPTDRPRPAKQTFEGAMFTFSLETASAAKLIEVASAAQATPFMVLLAAYAILLSRFSGRQDLVVGSPIAGRTRSELEPLIGCFVNTLALRIDLEGNPTFLQFLDRVKQVSLDSFAHQEMPFEKLIEELEPDRETSVTPIFQTMFVVQNASVGTLQLPGLSLEPFELETRTSKTDLTLVLSPAESGWLAQFEFNSTLFDESTIRRLASHYNLLLSRIAADPGCRLDSLSILSAEDLRLLELWGHCPGRYPVDQTIHGAFDEMVSADPDAIALVAGSERISYRELSHRSNALAAKLQSIGIGPDKPVAICLERSVELILGLLGIIKAGGAYVAMDPSHPVDRLAWLLQDSGAPVLLADQRALAGHASLAGVTVFRLPEWGTEGSEQPPVCQATARSLAYISHTSGSTGLPKGVAIEHRSVIRLVRNPNFASLTKDDVFLQFAPVAFDASTLEIWGALLNGARLVITPPGMPTLHELSGLLIRESVSVLWLSAGLFHLMVDEQCSILQQVKQVLAGGDVLSPLHVRKFLSGLPASHRLINGYGPTECTTFACCHAMRAGDAIGYAVPIGRPVSGTDVHVLDGQMRQVPIGVHGELHLGGDGLARGYWNRPELTRERFVPNPFSASLDSRLYRTGDHVRMRADGIIEFLGRLDNQVKIRGFRIEPGEVSAAVSASPLVRDSVVVVRGSGSQEKQLVAYVVWNQPGESNEPVLLADLKSRLPHFMIPSRFVTLAGLPLTPNGKVDRDALPEPAPVTRISGSSEPISAVEERVIQIWKEVLNLSAIAHDDNFFALGGHSLLATQIVSRLPAAFGVDLPVRVVFENPTVRELARAIEAAIPASPVDDDLGAILAQVQGMSEDEVLKELGGKDE